MSLFFLWMILLHSFHMSITAKPTGLEIILFFQSISVVFFIVLYYYMFFPLEVSLSKFRRLTSIKPKSSVRFWVRLSCNCLDHTFSVQRKNMAKVVQEFCTLFSYSPSWILMYNWSAREFRFSALWVFKMHILC